MALSLPFRSCFSLAPLRFSASKRRSPKFIMARTPPSTSRVTEDGGSQRPKKTTAEMLEILDSLEGWMGENINQTFLKPVESLWQPQDLLPNPSSPDEEFFEGVRGIRARASEIPDEFYVCLVGNMITEEALPTYQTLLNTFDGFRDATGVSETARARWIRQWTGEENRHGDLLNKYLYLSGRVDLKQIEKTIQHLLGAGTYTGADCNPFCGLIYTSFQERATFISHGNTARHAKRHGDATLAKLCGLIAADEKRHEMAYTMVVEKLFEVDPDTMMLAFAYMMKKRIMMPALLMFDGHDHNLFNHFSMVAQKVGVYTAKDYVDNVDFFVKRWNVEEISGGLSPEGRRAQEFVCGLVEKFKKMEERVMERKKGKERTELRIPFSWIFNREVVA